MNPFCRKLGVVLALACLPLSFCYAAPTLQVAPTGLDVPEGEVLSLRVVATGSALRYQWLLEGQAIPDATSPLFLRVRSAKENAGAYTVRVEDDAGGVVETTPVQVTVSKGVERPAGGVWDPYLDIPKPSLVEKGVVAVSGLDDLFLSFPGPWSPSGRLYQRTAVLQDGSVYRWSRTRIQDPDPITHGYVERVEDDSTIVPFAITSSRGVDFVESGCLLLESGALVVTTTSSVELPVEGKRLVALAGPPPTVYNANGRVALRNDGAVFSVGYPSLNSTIVPLQAISLSWGNDHGAIGVGIDNVGFAAIREDGFMYFQPFSITNGAAQLLAPPAGTRLVSGTPARAATLDHRLVRWDGSNWVPASPLWVQGSVIRNSGNLLILKPGPPVVARPPAGASVIYGKEISLEVDGGGVGALYTWYRGNTRVGDVSRDPRLLIPSAKPNDNGDYRVVISNEFGSVTSSPPAVVLVGPAPAANEVEALGAASIPLTMRQSIAQVQGGFTHLLTLSSSGAVKGLYLKFSGVSNYGEADVPSSAANDVVEIEAGMFTSAALKADGSVVRWGARRVPDPSKPDGVALKTEPIQTKAGRIATIRGGGNLAAIGIHGEVLLWNESLADYSAQGVPESLQSGVKEINRHFALKVDGTVVSLFGAPVAVEAESGMAHLVESSGEGLSSGAGNYNAAAGIKSDGRLIAWKDSGSRYLPTRLSEVVRLVSLESSGTAGFRKDLIAIGKDGRAESVWDEDSSSVVLPEEWQGRIQDLVPNGSLSGLGVVGLLKPAPGWVRVQTVFDGKSSYFVKAVSLRGLPLDIVVMDGPASVINGKVVFSRPGSVTLRVSEVNPLNPEDITSFTEVLEVKGPGKEQTLTLAPLGPFLMGAPAYPLSAQSSSGLPVVFSQQEGNPGMLLANGTVRGVMAGVFHLVVEQAGDSVFLPAPTLVRTVEILPGISLKRSGVGAAAGVILQIWAGDGQSANVEQSTNQTDWTLVAAVKGLGPDKPVTVPLPNDEPGQKAHYWRVQVTQW
jgi:hypothetical protein